MVNSHDLVEECLANIHRHSGSRTARISISSVDHHLFVQVSDAGKGLPWWESNRNSIIRRVPE